MSDNGRKILNIIIALIVSIGSWTYVVYNNDPMTEVKYKDIPITFQGEDYLANRGYGVSQVSIESIDVTLRQKRIETNDISAEDISVVADVSDAAEGENGISLKISGPDGTQVADAERRSVAVEVEEVDSLQKEIVIEYAGDISGYEPVTSEVTSNTATVLGAKSEIARVSKVAALLGLDETENKLNNYSCKLVALDEDGDEIPHAVIYPREINFYAYTGTLKEVPLKVVTEPAETEKQAAADEDSDGQEDNQDDGYTRTVVAPDTIVIKGSEGILQGVNEVSTEVIDISNMYEDQEIDLVCDLPEGVYLADESKNIVLKVKVTRKQTEEEH